MPEQLKYLWSSDFDGTLYEGKRSEASISKEIIETIALWIRYGGYFHLLSSGSMAGMSRDGFDFIPNLLRTLSNHLSIPDAVSLMRDRISFSMSNGGEHYSIVDPHKSIMEGQLCLDESRYAWVSKQEAIAFCQEMAKQFQMITLNTDPPVSGESGRISAIFLKHLSHIDGEDGFTVQERFNDTLRSLRKNLWVRFVREERSEEESMKRFDAYPLFKGVRIGKGDVVGDLFPQFSSVVYTGDQAQGNDRPVFDYMKTRREMHAWAVHGPKDVAQVIRKCIEQR